MSNLVNIIFCEIKRISFFYTNKDIVDVNHVVYYLEQRNVSSLDPCIKKPIKSET